MSTKTTFKRIALVAVAALGLGVLSVAPSSAIVSGLTVTVSNGTAGAVGAASDTTTGATISISGLMDNGLGDSVTVQFIQRTSAPATSVAVPVLAFLDTTTSTLAGSTQVSRATIPFATARARYTNTNESVTAGTGGYTITGTTLGTATYVGAKFALYLDSLSSTVRPAGTYGYTVLVKTYHSTSSTPSVAVATSTYDVDITVAKSASVSTTPAAANEFARLANATTGSNYTSDGVDDVATSVSTVGTVAGYVTVGVRNATGTDATVAQDSVTATITGAGVLCENVSGTCGRSFLLASTGDAKFTVKADGTAGVATIALKTNTVTFASKTVTFYAAAAKTITPTVNNPVLAVGANAQAISATAVDANGTAWTGAMYIVASTAADALVGGSATTPVACTFDTTDLVHYCPVTAIAAGTASFKLIDASTVALATATSAAVSVTVSSEKAATVKLSFDKATYAPFEKATISVTPLSATGKNLPAQTLAALLATGGITSTYAFSAGSDTLTASLISTSALTGVKKYTVYMPAASGPVVITATGGTALSAAGQVAVTATATVVNASVDAATDAANEATDAANAATDAALAAADAADAATAAAQDASDAVAALSASVEKLVASLKAQLTSLTNLVIKIQKKVKA